ncbi:SVM family protein [Candidatus Phytoplasma rubi]|uniref:SVM family protein n=1 Tax=Candidatus Phytoplasma rubi TaxID=399025 RepID=A0ABY7BR45_9MOLU|nr:SVM family protein [Candidatus Phytoplasma rubi]WAN63195.1 SVM family protein [Candidatus Phytoplasma rubi]
MIKLKNQFKIISVYLCAFLGLLFIFNNKQVIAMNNNNVGTSENVYNSLEEYRNYQNLLVSQQTKAQEVINAFEHKVSETEKKLLFDQLELIHQQIIITQQRHLDIQQQITINLILNNEITELERLHSLLMQEMTTIINNIPLYASEEQINLLRNTQIRINQNQENINTILEQIRNQSPMPRINLSRNRSSQKR